MGHRDVVAVPEHRTDERIPEHARLGDDGGVGNRCADGGDVHERRVVGDQHVGRGGQVEPRRARVVSRQAGDAHVVVEEDPGPADDPAALPCARPCVALAQARDRKDDVGKQHPDGEEEQEGASGERGPEHPVHPSPHGNTTIAMAIRRSWDRLRTAASPPDRASAAEAVGPRRSRGAAFGSRTTSMSVSATPLRIPSPSALRKASLAAKRAA